MPAAAQPACLPLDGLLLVVFVSSCVVVPVLVLCPTSGHRSSIHSLHYTTLHSLHTRSLHVLYTLYHNHCHRVYIAQPTRLLPTHVESAPRCLRSAFLVKVATLQNAPYWARSQERRTSPPANVDHPLLPHPLRFCSSTPAALSSSFCPSAFTTHPLLQRTHPASSSSAPRPSLGCPVTCTVCRLGLLARRSLCTNSAHCVPHTRTTTLVYPHPIPLSIALASHCRPHLLACSLHPLAHHVAHAAIA
jgi:hypothetical protein